MPRWLTFALALVVAVSRLIGAESPPLKVGVETDLYPITFLDEHGRPVGFAIDLLDAIAREAKFEVAYVVRPRTEMFADFTARRVDALANVVHTREREAYMAYSVSHLKLRSTVFVRRGESPIRNPEDLRPRRLVGIPNSRGHEYLKARDLAQNFIPVPTQREALRVLAEGKADATIGTRLMGLKIVADDRLTNVTTASLELPDLTYRYHFVLHPDDVRRLAVINESLAQLRANGTYDEIYEKWVGPLEPRELRLEDMRPYLWPGVAVLIAVSIAFLWQRYLFRHLARQATALRQSEERLTLVFRGSADGFWDWDVASGHVERSERWASMLGYTLAEIPPTIEGSRQLVHPDDLPAYDDGLELVTDNQAKRREVEHRMRAKSGEWRWILNRGMVVERGPDGRPRRVAGTHTDITERKRTEAALRESEILLKRSARLLEQAQAVTHIGGWETDLSTGRLFWTDETYRIYETTPADFQPTVASVLQCYPEESRQIVAAAGAEARKNGTPFDLEVDLVTLRGRLLKVQLIGRAEREDGRLVKLYGSVRDITDQKRAEEAQEELRLKMLETQKLESLGVLAGGIAHDFNNLLTVIVANASFARLAPAAADEVDDRLLQIEQAAHRAADLCRQMLAYAGKGRLVEEPVNLSALVQDTARLIGISINKKARLITDLDPDLPQVRGDPSQLRQVVMNLLINASEALSEHSGEIRLTTTRGRPAPRSTGVFHNFDLPLGDCVCLEVADTGCGMSASTLARIFDPFFTTKFAGRGLGLAAVLGIVRSHSGALDVQSSPGHGSTFRLYLPAARTETPATKIPSKAQEGIVPSSAVVLIADDEPAVLAAADSVLRHYGYETVLAKDGTEAVEAFRVQPQGFAAVLVDLTMPGLNGAEVLRSIRSINPAIRVLLMSGYSEDDVLERLQGQDRVTILRKPFTQESLIARVNEVVSAA